jgi:hypothetical protein
MLDFSQPTWYHIQIRDPKLTMINIWTTGKYHIAKTNYHKITKKPIIERTGEIGMLPTKKIKLGRFLDKAFYAADALEDY